MEAPKAALEEAVEGRGLAIFIRIAISGCFIRLVTPGKNHISRRVLKAERKPPLRGQAPPHPEHLGLDLASQKTTVCQVSLTWSSRHLLCPDFLLLLLWSHLRNLKSSLSFHLCKANGPSGADFILNLVLFWDFEYLKNMTNNLPLYTFCAVQPRSGSINVW